MSTRFQIRESESSGIDKLLIVHDGQAHAGQALIGHLGVNPRFQQRDIGSDVRMPGEITVRNS